MKSPTALEFQNRVRSPFPVKAIDWYDYEMAADPDLGWKNKKEVIEGLRWHLHFCIRCPKQEIKLGFRRCHEL